LRESLGYTWYLVKCIDPDGTRLNEGWFKGPFSIENLARHYYPLSLEYARAFCDRMSFIRPFTLGCLLSPICERPYFYHPAIEDTSASDRVRRDAILPDAVDRCGRLIRKR